MIIQRVICTVKLGLSRWLITIWLSPTFCRQFPSQVFHHPLIDCWPILALVYSAPTIGYSSLAIYVHSRWFISEIKVAHDHLSQIIKAVIWSTRMAVNFMFRFSFHRMSEIGKSQFVPQSTLWLFSMTLYEKGKDGETYKTVKGVQSGNN